MSAALATTAETMATHARHALYGALRAAGYVVQVIGTGGGCTAVHVTGGRLGSQGVLVTDDDATVPFGPLVVDDGEQAVPMVVGAWTVGLYSDADTTDEPLRTVDHTDLDPIESDRVAARVESIVAAVRHVACCGDPVA